MKEITLITDLATSIHHLRKRAHLSQQQLADLAGLSRTAIQGIQAGKATTQLDTLLRVLDVLNIKLYIDHPLLTEGDDNENTTD